MPDNQFLISMGHELQISMNTMINHLDLMRTDNLDGEQIKHMDAIKQTSAMLMRTVNDILDFQEVESGKLEILPIHFNLCSFYNKLNSRYKFLAESKNLEFKSLFALDLPRAIFGDEQRIEQIVSNLLSYAVQYTREGYVSFRVDIAVDKGGECIVFTVEYSGFADNGVGSPFTERLADLMEGHIRFTSEHGKDSKCSFSIPLVRGDLDQVNRPDGTAKRKTEAETTLLCDDEVEKNKLLEELVTIQDLSVASGLVQADGDKKLYIAILWQFCLGAEEDANALKKYAMNGLMTEYAIRIHALKTVFANMGHQFLSDWAFSLEQAALRGDTAKCIRETNLFCDAMTQLHIKLQQTDLINNIASRARKKKTTVQALKKKLSQLYMACNDYRAETAEPIAKELLSATINTKVDASLKTLNDLVCSFDYDQAVELIEDLLKLL